MNNWKKISSRIALENKWYRVRIDEVITPEGKNGQYNVVETTDDGVIIVPIDNDKNIYLIHLYRYPTDCDSWELPKGRMDGQVVTVAAKRELQEETGLIAGKITKIGYAYPLNGLYNESTHVVIAENLSPSADNKKAEEGIDKIMKISINKALGMIKNNEITDGQTISALTKAILHLGLKF